MYFSEMLPSQDGRTERGSRRTASDCYAMPPFVRRLTPFLSLVRLLLRAEGVEMQNHSAFLLWRKQWNAVIPRECCPKRSGVFAC